VVSVVAGERAGEFLGVGDLHPFASGDGIARVTDKISSGAGSMVLSSGRFASGV
jgi:hypothetical protein